MPDHSNPLDSLQSSLYANTSLISEADLARASAARDLRAFADECEQRARRHAAELPRCGVRANDAVVMAYRRAAEIVEHGLTEGRKVDLDWIDPDG